MNKDPDRFTLAIQGVALSLFWVFVICSIILATVFVLAISWIIISEVFL